MASSRFVAAAACRRPGRRAPPAPLSCSAARRRRRARATSIGRPPVVGALRLRRPQCSRAAHRSPRGAATRYCRSPRRRRSRLRGQREPRLSTVPRIKHAERDPTSRRGRRAPSTGAAVAPRPAGRSRTPHPRSRRGCLCANKAVSNIASMACSALRSILRSARPRYHESAT